MPFGVGINDLWGCNACSGDALEMLVTWNELDSVDEPFEGWVRCS